MLIQPPSIKYSGDEDNRTKGKARSVYHLEAMQFAESNITQWHSRRLIGEARVFISMYKNVIADFIYGSIEIAYYAPIVILDIFCKHPIISGLINVDPLIDTVIPYKTLSIVADEDGNRLTEEIEISPLAISGTDPLLNYMFDNKNDYRANWQMNMGTCNISWAGSICYYWGNAYRIENADEKTYQILCASVSGDFIYIAAFNEVIYDDDNQTNDEIKADSLDIHLFSIPRQEASLSTIVIPVSNAVHTIQGIQAAWDEMLVDPEIPTDSSAISPLFGESGFSENGLEFKTIAYDTGRYEPEINVHVTATLPSESQVWTDTVEGLYIELNQVPLVNLYNPTQKPSEGDFPMPDRVESKEEDDPPEADYFTTKPLPTATLWYEFEGAIAYSTPEEVMPVVEAGIEAAIALVEYKEVGNLNITREITASNYTWALASNYVDYVQGSPDIPQAGLLSSVDCDLHVIDKTYEDGSLVLTEEYDYTYLSVHESENQILGFYGEAATDIAYTAANGFVTVVFYVVYEMPDRIDERLGTAAQDDLPYGYFKNIDTGALEQCYLKDITGAEITLLSFTPPSGYDAFYFAFRGQTATPVDISVSWRRDFMRALYPDPGITPAIGPEVLKDLSKMDIMAGEVNITNDPHESHWMERVHPQAGSCISRQVLELAADTSLKFYHQGAVVYDVPYGAWGSFPWLPQNNPYYNITPLSTKKETLFSAAFNYDVVYETTIKSSDLTYSLELDAIYASSPYMIHRP